MKSNETKLALRALIARGVSTIALLFLVACATTSTTPVSRQADPAFARKTVTYPTPVPPGTIVIDPGSHFLYLVQGGGQAIRYGVGVGGEGLGGQVRLRVTQELKAAGYTLVDTLQFLPRQYCLIFGNGNS